MKKSIIIVITIILVIAAIWCVFNVNKYTIVNDGVIQRPLIYLGRYDSSTGLYVSDNLEYGYGKCPLGQSCPEYTVAYKDSYHKYYAYGANGELIVDVNHEYLELDVVDNNIYKDAVDFEGRFTRLSQRYRMHELFGVPELPEPPSISDYVGGKDNELAEIVGFFQWLGNIFIYIFKVLKFIIDYILYYFEYVKIFFKELLL